MKTVKILIDKIKTVPKIKLISILSILILFISISIPSLARFKNRENIEEKLNELEIWDGTVASSYHSGIGSINNPYIISNAKELAFFAQSLKTTNYQNTYFKLSNNIVINKGKFNYDETNKITYNLDGTTHYVKEFTNEIHNNPERTSVSGNVNIFNTLNNFKGNFNGDYYRIYGLYMTGQENDISLFNNLQGNVENLYIENALIYGGNKTAILSNKATNAKLNNIFVNGNVIGTKIDSNEIITKNIDNVIIEKTIEQLNQKIQLPKLPIDNIKSIKLKGNYKNTLETQEVKLNDILLKAGDFELDLGTNLQDFITITATDNVESTITLENMKYIITYEYPISSGIIAKAENSTLRNIINKSNVYGTNTSGIIGLNTNSNIENSYNTGKIKGTKNSTGLVNQIINSNQEIIINKLYNNGIIEGNETSLIGNIISNNKILLKNTFNTKTLNYTITNIIDQVRVENVIDINQNSIKTGTTINSITKTNLSTIKNKEYLRTTLDYGEYVDNIDLNVNRNNVWTYNEENLPVLYIDDTLKPVVSLNIGTNKYTDLGYELKQIFINKETPFQIESVDAINPLSNIEYYIHDKKTPLRKEEIKNITTWKKYENITNITKEGYNIIYVKATDQNNKIYYVNSEIMVLDTTAPEMTLKLYNYIWNNNKEKLDSINVYETVNLNVTATDTYSNIKSIEYILTKTPINQNELPNIKDKWLPYKDKITINEKGSYIIYLKAEDTCNNIKYINSDIIVFGGYEEQTYPGRNNEINNKNLNITNNSIVKYNFKYNQETKYKDGVTNNFISNILLPKNTKLTLINNSNNNVYSYIIESENDLYNYNTSCDTPNCEKFATYKLNKFQMIGSNNNIYFNDREYIETIKKDLTLIIDFKNTNIKNQTLKLYKNITDNNNNEILSTLKSTINNVNIYENSNNTITINKTNNSKIIEYNSDSSTVVNLQIVNNKKYINNQLIYDTTIENSKLALYVQLIDNKGNTIPKTYLKNIEFKVGNNSYSPDNDGIVRIDILNKVDTVNTNLEIVTHLTNLKLKTGNYNFKISPVITNDGKYSNEIINSNILIPLTTTYVEKPIYSFNTIIEDKYKIIDKEAQKIDIPVIIVNQTQFANPIIKVSLYKKDQLTAYNQNYTIIDLQNYSINQLEKIGDKKYKVKSNNLNLNLNLSKFEKTGYELRFELYDNETFITKIDNKFIIK